MPNDGLERSATTHQDVDSVPGLQALRRASEGYGTRLAPSGSPECSHNYPSGRRCSQMLAYALLGAVKGAAGRADTKGMAHHGSAQSAVMR